MLGLANISKRYGSQVVLDDATWAVPDGARVGLTGPNGAGKSTLLRIIAGEVEPDRGQVALPRGAQVGYLPQNVLGLSGVILLAYVVAIPANEIVVPTILMLTVLVTGAAGVGQGAGVMFELDSTGDTAAVLAAGGWTLLTGVCLMLFSLVHNPCSTTIYTIWKETRSAKWTAVAALMPLALGFVLCFFVAQTWRLVAG